MRLAEVSIFTDKETGILWAHTYDLPPRDSSPYPLPDSYAAVAEPDAQGGIARMSSCRCGNGCVCPACGQRTISVARGLEWAESLLLNGDTHTDSHWGWTSCPAKDSVECPDCCAMPMMLSPVGWVCRRESVHRRSYRWPRSAAHTAPSVEWDVRRV